MTFFRRVSFFSGTGFPKRFGHSASKFARCWNIFHLMDDFRKSVTQKILCDFGLLMHFALVTLVHEVAKMIFTMHKVNSPLLCRQCSLILSRTMSSER
jgi:hypothetical protein